MRAVTSVAAARRVIDTGAGLLSGLWILGLALKSCPSCRQSSRVALGASLALPGVGLVLWAALRLLSANWFLLVLSVTAFVQLLITAPGTSFAASSAWADLTTLMIGVLVVGTKARTLILSYSALFLCGKLLVAFAAGSLSQHWVISLLSTAYALAVGMAANGAARALRAVARSEDEAARVELAAASEFAAAKARSDEKFRLSRTLHDTIINTLGAVRRGIDQEHSDLVRSRVADDLTRIEQIKAVESLPTMNSRSTTSEIRIHALRRAPLIGLTLSVTSDGEDMSAPRNVEQALIGAVDEALTNVAKHSGVNEATLHVISEPGAIQIVVSDDGRGLRPGRSERGGGLDRSIHQRVRREGIASRLTSASGDGTSVELTGAASESSEDRGPDC